MFRRLVLLLFILFHVATLAQEEIRLISWNIRDFGKTKNSEELDQIANIVKNTDILAIQEVVAGYGGAQAVAKLANKLNRKGSQWDYVISDPTNSSKYATERYAFVWKTKHIKIKNRGALLTDLDSLVDREPFYIDFYLKGEKFSVLNFHSRPHHKNPEAEISAITAYLEQHRFEHPIILAGDFNVDERKSVFDGLKALGFTAAVSNKKTTLKRSCEKNNYLNYAIDNVFYSAQLDSKESGVIDFVQFCESLERARKLSDHLPVFLKFNLM